MENLNESQNNNGSGWIKLHRKTLESPLWKSLNPKQKVILLTCLMLANHSTNKWMWAGQEFECKPGEFVTSVDSLIEHCGRGFSRQTVRATLLLLQKAGFSTIKTTNHGTQIKVLQWEKYQVGEKNQPTNQPLTNQRPTTNKNVKNDKEYIYNKKIKNSETKSQSFEHPEKNKLFKFLKGLMPYPVAKFKTEDYFKKYGPEVIRPTLSNIACIGEPGFIKCAEFYSKKKKN